MRPILYIGLAASLALGACSSTYKTAQTPDDVYYSPRQQQRTYASNNGSNGNSKQDENDANYVQGDQTDGGNYVTYQDEDQGDYQRRLNRFGNGGSNYSGDYWDGYNAASSMYMMGGYGMGYGGFGMGYGPYSSFYGPSLSLGIGWGMGGYYSPWNAGFYGGGWGYPYIGSYWPSYYNPYYGGGYYGGGYYGHGGGYYGHGYNSRPSNSYGPIRASGERVPRANYTNSGGGVNGGGGYTRPNRTGVFQPVNGGGNGGTVNPGGSVERPRRVFQQSNSERPVTRPAYQNSNNNSGDNGGYSRPQRVEYSRPAPSPAPSYTPSNSGGGGGRSSGGGGGGGYSRPSRGGR